MKKDRILIIALVIGTLLCVSFQSAILANISNDSHSGCNGSLVILIRCDTGLLLASDSRLYDPLTKKSHDGYQKIFYNDSWIWFITGIVTYQAVDASNLSEISSYDFSKAIKENITHSRINSIDDLAAYVLNIQLNEITSFYKKNEMEFPDPGTELSILGLLLQENKLLLARIFINDERTLTAQLIPVDKIPRICVFGNDRVYRAIKTKRASFESYYNLPIFQQVLTKYEDPSKEKAIEFVKQLINITSERDSEFGPTDEKVGGEPWFLFISKKGSEWIQTP
ncbi:MAG: hypothetical protein V1733_06970 [bacterium]